MPTVADLKNVLALANAKWIVDDRLRDADQQPKFPTGGDLTKAQRVQDVARTDIKPFLAVASSNPYLLKLRRDSGFLTKAIPVEIESRMTAEAAAVPGAPVAGTSPAPSIGAAGSAGLG